MSLQKYIDNMRKIEESLLKFLEEDEDDEIVFQLLKKLLNDLKFLNNRYNLKSF